MSEQTTWSEQLTASGFAPTPDPTGYRHGCGLSVRIGDTGDPTITVLNPPEPWMAGKVPLADERDLSAFCWSHGLITPFAVVRDALAPWPGEDARPGVCYRDGPDIRARSRGGDLSLTAATWPGRPDPATGASALHLVTCGGLLGVFTHEGVHHRPEGDDRYGSVTLTRGTQHATLRFEDAAASRDTVVFLPGPAQPDGTLSWAEAASLENAAALETLFAHATRD